MKLVRIRLCNFWSFGSVPVEISLDPMTFLIGPNGAGKTAVLQALARMFSMDPAQRRIRPSDFNVPQGEDADHAPEYRDLWIEADFEFPELLEDCAEGESLPAVPASFAHMQLLDENGPVQVRFRLSAKLDQENEIEDKFTYVIKADDKGRPVEESAVAKQERNAIQVHYLPARRDPSDHISYSTNALLGRALRAADWSSEREEIKALTAQISESLAGNSAIDRMTEALTTQWSEVHKGEYYASPSVSFSRNEIEGLLRHLTVRFTPGHAEPLVDFSRLSDGQQSLLYLSLVLAMQNIGSRVLRGDLWMAFDVHKLRPATFTLIAIEEPENSLSPHYLGRVIRALSHFSNDPSAQAVIATHSPALLRRVPPESIRYVRLGAIRETVVKHVDLPEGTAAYKFVREGVQAFPELYFSRLVVLGEGASEDIVLTRLLQARGILSDDASVSVVPLGGRHVNHFWRLLNGLAIPHVTLLDLDTGRHNGGWGRIKYAAKELIKYSDASEHTIPEGTVNAIPAWDHEQSILVSDNGWISRLESLAVFFSGPLDLDFLMMRAYPRAYQIKNDELQAPDQAAITAVLGKARGTETQYSEEEQLHFDAYHTRFKIGSKPTWHLRALSRMNDEDVLRGIPEVLSRMLDRIKAELEALPE